MTKPSHDENLIKINLQLFAEGEEVELDDNDSDDSDEDIPSEADTEDTPSEGEESEEEFDEISYNKETVKIPKSQRKEFLQKGYNYDKVHGKLTESQAAIKEIESLTGMDINNVREYLKNQKIEQEAQAKAELLGVTPEIAKEMIQQKVILEELKQRDLSREQERINIQQKAELKDKPFFKELEQDIDAMMANVPGIDVKTAYFYVRGEKMDELLGKEKSNTAKRVVADMQDRAKYKGSSLNNDASTGSEALSKEAMEMAAAFGTDPKKISKYVKENLKRR